eukprot:1191386-Prorocentrum_minimum.AAC.1
MFIYSFIFPTLNLPFTPTPVRTAHRTRAWETLRRKRWQSRSRDASWRALLKTRGGRCARQGYLVARQHMEGILATAALMQHSGLPCFSRGHPIKCAPIRSTGTRRAPLKTNVATDAPTRCRRNLPGPRRDAARLRGVSYPLAAAWPWGFAALFCMSVTKAYDGYLVVSSDGLRV